ncbi:rRNA maturation RNase YbeY [Limosilactobacillus antri]|uniref:rRNA maturation RNase YbeY n=1 Tax=Limosilactobacillus antri TaxID=227943 RepID=UPI001F595C19|nr:rRNA maturation RNase YbeY [Limosilactobacillus antri]
MDLTIYDETAGRVSEDQLALIRDVLQFAAGKLSLKANTEMSVTLMTNPAIRKLNQQYRGVDRATDVLSFAAEERGDETPIIMDPELAAEIPENLGDLFVSVDKVAEQAKFLGHSADRELGFLVVHGFLHLNGYDHEEPADEQRMFDLQREILNEYGLQR